MSEFVEEVGEELHEDDPASVREDTKLSELPGWDSMGVLGVIALIDEKFGKVVVVEELQKCQTVADIYAIAKR